MCYIFCIIFIIFRNVLYFLYYICYIFDICVIFIIFLRCFIFFCIKYDIVLLSIGHWCSLVNCSFDLYHISYIFSSIFDIKICIQEESLVSLEESLVSQKYNKYNTNQNKIQILMLEFCGPTFC